MKQTPRLELLPIDTLIPYANNARTHSDDQIKKIQASLREFGFINPILIDAGRGIIAGHGRIEAAKREGMTEVPCVFVEHLTDAQKRAYILADNRLAELAGWDMDAVRIEIERLAEDGFGIEITGFEFDDIPMGKIAEDDFDADAVADAIAEPVTKLGDIWTLGRHRLMCGDSTDRANVGRLMDGAKADMVFTDPPYGINLDTDYSQLPSTKKEGNRNYSRVAGDDKQFDYQLFQWLQCKEQIWFGANYYAKTLPDGGSWLVWDKRCEEKFDRMFGSGFEIAWSKVPHKQKIYRHNNTLFGGDSEARGKEHPTQKPTKLCADIIGDIGEENDIVLDPFGGSGSTLIACEQLNRTCYMMELDPKYCDVIIMRWETLTGDKAVLNG